MHDNKQDPSPLAVTRKKAAESIGCSVDHIDHLVSRGRLIRIRIGERRVAIVWSSIQKLVAEAADVGA
jgi:hypothetical protein